MNCHRKLKAKFKSTMDYITGLHGWGAFRGGTSRNLSGKEGDITELASLVAVCLEQIDKVLSEKEAKKEEDKENTPELSVIQSLFNY